MVGSMVGSAVGGALVAQAVVGFVVGLVGFEVSLALGLFMDGVIVARARWLVWRCAQGNSSCSCWP